MKRKISALAVVVVLLVACHNSNSSTVGEKDEDYPKTFGHGAMDPHQPPPADRIQVTRPVDTLGTPHHSADTTSHH